MDLYLEIISKDEEILQDRTPVNRGYYRKGLLRSLSGWTFIGSLRRLESGGKVHKKFDLLQFF